MIAKLTNHAVRRRLETPGRFCLEGSEATVVVSGAGNCTRALVNLEIECNVRRNTRKPGAGGRQYGVRQIDPLGQREVPEDRQRADARDPRRPGGAVDSRVGRCTRCPTGYADQATQAPASRDSKVLPFRRRPRRRRPEDAHCRWIARRLLVPARPTNRRIKSGQSQTLARRTDVDQRQPMGRADVSM